MLTLKIYFKNAFTFLLFWVSLNCTSRMGNGSSFEMKNRSSLLCAFTKALYFLL